MKVDLYTLLAWASHHEPAASPFLHRTLLPHFFHRPPEAEVEPKTISTSSRREHLGGSDLDPDVGYLGHYLIFDGDLGFFCLDANPIGSASLLKYRFL
jgi:hypothetical protein